MAGERQSKIIITGLIYPVHYGVGFYINTNAQTIKPGLSPVYMDMRYLHALTHAISDLNEVQDQIESIKTVCLAL